MSLTLRIALRYLLSVRGSTLLITLISFFGVFLSVSAILLTLGVFTGFQDSLKEKMAPYPLPFTAPSSQRKRGFSP